MLFLSPLQAVGFPGKADHCMGNECRRGKVDMDGNDMNCLAPGSRQPYAEPGYRPPEKTSEVHCVNCMRRGRTMHAGGCACLLLCVCGRLTSSTLFPKREHDSMYTPFYAASRSWYAHTRKESIPPPN